MDNGLRYLAYHQTSMQGGDGLYSRMAFGGQQLFEDTIDPDLEHKTRRVADKFSENINAIANEPSLAFFRIQEHVRKTLPQLVEQKHEVQEIQQKVQGACFDTEYATNAVKTMHQSSVHFQNIQDLLKNAMFMKQQIGYEELRRKQEMMNPSMYTNSPSREALYKTALSQAAVLSPAATTTDENASTSGEGAATTLSQTTVTSTSSQTESTSVQTTSSSRVASHITVAQMSDSSTVPTHDTQPSIPSPLTSSAPSIQSSSRPSSPITGGDEEVGPQIDTASEVTEEIFVVQDGS